MQLTAVAAAAVLAAVPAAIPAAPARWVEDQAALMTPAAREALDGRLEGYERATGHQVVVWIGKTIDGAPLADWAVKTFGAWKVGRKGFDDGIAMFILADDRTIDIEVGYGLEDKVTDAAASRIIREVMAPRLRAGDRDGAVTAGAEAVLSAIEGKPWAGGPAGATAPPPANEVPAGATGSSTTTWILGGLAGLFALILLIKYPRLAVWILWAIVSGGRRGGGSGGGLGGDGGFGGGSVGGGSRSGGFSGGGGRSGGGGARGGW